MITNVSEYLYATSAKYPEKKAFEDEKRSITFSELKKEAEHIAMGLLTIGTRKPVAIFLSKSVEMISAFLGTIISGNFYSPIDTQMPMERIKKMTDTLDSFAVITDKAHYDEALKTFPKKTVFVYEELMTKSIYESKLAERRKKILDTDLAYVLFTSGSTGNPKGVMISEKGLIDFLEWATDYFHLNDSYIFGNQVPFYFSMYIYDVFQTIKNGATCYIIPHKLFLFPAELMNYLLEKSVNALIWVPSALCMISAVHPMTPSTIPPLKLVIFGGEVMPVKQLNRWMKAFPQTVFCNVYGPTEVTDTCSAYIISRKIADIEPIPIGESCTNKEILVLNDDDEPISRDETGEICVRGSGLSYGYYNNEEATRKAFVQNPLNSRLREIIYKTGDLAKYNEYGELIYAGRKDFQIKKMGHRIELGEIEGAANSIEQLESCCCVYDSLKKRIFLFFVGSLESEEVFAILKAKLPRYMIPNRCIKMNALPLNLNGKMDRIKLKELIKN